MAQRGEVPDELALEVLEPRPPHAPVSHVVRLGERGLRAHAAVEPANEIGQIPELPFELLGVALVVSPAKGLAFHNADRYIPFA